MTTMNTQNDQYNRHAMIKNIREGVQAIRHVYYGNYPVEHQRGWHVTMSNKHDLHPAIFQAIDIAPPTDWHQLVLEYPYISESDPSRLAYTRDERSGINDRQTVTTIGKYLARHFPDVSDHMIREIAAQYSGATCKIMNTMPEMLDVVRNGAKSCMTMIHRDDSEHPYQAYDPELGWSIAVRMDGTTYRARALVYTDPESETDTAYFVRSYNKPDNPSSYSQPDDLLEAWLKGQGIAKRDSWEGAVLRYIPYGDFFLAPFLDGHDKQVEITSSVRRLMTVTSGGEYTFDNTDGTPTNSAGDCECANCGDMFHEDDGHWAGVHGDDHICDYCARDNYTYAYTRHGNQHYIHSDDVVYVESQREYYHDRYLGENNIVRCVDTDEYEHTDEAVYLERESEWYSSGSDAIVYCDHSSEYELIDNCVELHDGEWAHTEDTWECGHSNNYYLCDEVRPYRTSCGTLVHPDYANQYAEAIEPTTQGE
jgi:hypothetical protein